MISKPRPKNMVAWSALLIFILLVMIFVMAGTQSSVIDSVKDPWTPIPLPPLLVSPTPTPYWWSDPPTPVPLFPTPKGG